MTPLLVNDLSLTLRAEFDFFDSPLGCSDEGHGEDLRSAHELGAVYSFRVSGRIFLFLDRSDEYLSFDGCVSEHGHVFTAELVSEQV